MLVIGCRAIVIKFISLHVMATSNIRTKFGSKVRAFRIKQGYSQETLADVAGLHRTYIGSIERGEQNVSIDNIAKLAKALRITVADLFS